VDHGADADRERRIDERLPSDGDASAVAAVVDETGR
jgi:hypothetical protein